MKQLKLIALTLIIAGISTSQASIVAYDYTDAPKTATITTTLGGTEEGTANVYFSLTGVDFTAGVDKLEINLYASAKKSNEEAYVQLGSGFKTAVLDDLVGLTTIFTQGVVDLIAVGKGDTDSYDSYLALELKGGNGETYYGWAKVRADVSHAQGGNIKTATSSFTVTSFAYNDVEDDSIVVGAIPEPAVASLIILFGTGILFSRRIFTK